MSKRPTWALAYILQDLTKRGRPAIRDAYKLACDDERADTDGPPSPEAESARLEALRKLRVYVAALEEVAPDAGVSG